MKKTLTSLLLLVFLQHSMFAQAPIVVGNKIGDQVTTAETTPPSTGATCCTINNSFPAPGPWPGGIAWDGEHLWVSDYTQPLLYKMDTLGNVLETIPSPAQIGDSGGGLSFDGTNLLIVVEQEGKLYTLNPDNGQLVQETMLPEFDPPDNNHLGVTFDGQYIWNVHHSPEFLIKIDPIANMAVDTIPLPAQVIVLEWIDDKLYGLVSFFNATPYLYTIDPVTGDFTDSIDWCLQLISDIAFDGKNVWAMETLPNNTIYKLETCLALTTASDEQAVLDEISIFPNPTTGKIHVEAAGATRFELSVPEGNQLPMETQGQEIDLSGLPSGTYFLRIFFGEKMVVRKVVKV